MALNAGWGTTNGTGTVEDPYQIEDAADWDAITTVDNSLDRPSFVLVNDVNYGGTITRISTFYGNLDFAGYRLHGITGYDVDSVINKVDGNIIDGEVNVAVNNGTTNAYIFKEIDFNGSINKMRFTGSLTVSGAAEAGVIELVKSGRVFRNCISELDLSTVDGDCAVVHRAFGTEDRCIATGVHTASGIGTAYGFAADNGATNCFFDSTVSPTSTATTGSTGKTTEELQTLSTYTDTATVGLDTVYDMTAFPHDGLEATSIWALDEGNAYPIFYFEVVPITTTTKTVTADTTLGNWVDEGGGTTTIYDGLADDSDATYIESANSPQYGDEYVATLARPDSGKTIDTSQDVTLNVRYSRDAAGAGDLAVRWHVRSEGTDIVTRTFTAVSDTIAEDNYTLTTQEKADLKSAIDSGQVVQLAFEANL